MFVEPKNLLPIALLPLLIIACGDDENKVASVPEHENSSSSLYIDDEAYYNADYDAEVYEMLPECTSKKNGSTGYVIITRKTYVCKDGEWIGAHDASSSSSNDEVSSSNNEADKSSSSSEVVESSSSQDVESSSSEVVEFSSSSEVVFSSSSEAVETSSSEKMKSSSSIFVSHGTMVDSRDNRVYKTVTIGRLTWMAENLNYDFEKDTTGVYCYNDEENCEKYGRLYSLSAAMRCISEPCPTGELIRGACPENWHISTEYEWEQLIETVGGDSIAGIRLKSSEGWLNEGDNGTDDFGFSVLPAGVRAFSYSYQPILDNMTIVGFEHVPVTKYEGVGYSTHFWTPATNRIDPMFIRYINYAFGENGTSLRNFVVVNAVETSTTYAFSVRCVKDIE